MGSVARALGRALYLGWQSQREFWEKQGQCGPSGSLLQYHALLTLNPEPRRLCLGHIPSATTPTTPPAPRLSQRRCRDTPRPRPPTCPPSVWARPRPEPRPLAGPAPSWSPEVGLGPPAAVQSDALVHEDRHVSALFTSAAQGLERYVA